MTTPAGRGGLTTASVMTAGRHGDSGLAGAVVRWVAGLLGL